MDMLTIKNPRLARLVSAACVIVSVGAFSGCGEPGARALLDGEQMINERRFAEAVDRLKLATHLLPENPQAWNHRGLAHHGAQQRAEAAEAYRYALKLNENLAAARYNLGALLLESGDPLGAIEELGSFVVLRPTSVEGHVRLGSAQIRADLWADAARTYTQAFQMSDSNPEILNALGVIHLHHGEREKAMPFFDRAIELNANYAPAKLNKAICEHRYGGDRQRALDAYNRFALEHPNAPQAEEAMIVAAALDRELHPRPLTAVADGEASQPRKLEFAQMTDRATSAAGDNVAATGPGATGEASSNTTGVDESESTPPTMAFKPLTERAEGTGVTEIAMKASASANSAAIESPARAAVAEPVPPAVREQSFPRVREPAPPVARSAPAEPGPESTAKMEAAAGRKESVAVVKPLAAEVAPPAKDLPTPPPGEAVHVAEVSPPKPEAPTAPVEVKAAKEAAPAAPAVVVAVEETQALVEARAEPKIIPSPPAVVTARPVQETGAGGAAPPRSYVPAYHPPREEAEDRGLLQRLNPRRFFKSRETERKTTPLPGGGMAGRPAPQADEATRPNDARRDLPSERGTRPVQTVVQPAPPPVRVDSPRYAYRNPSPPRTGDRRAAAPIFLEGLKAHQENRLSEAIKAYKDAAKLDGSLYEAHYNLGLASYRANQLAESLAAYETALAVKPDSSSARFNFAQALLKARYTRDSANELEKLIAAEPDEVAARLAAGNLYAKELGDLARARLHYLKVLELEPNHRQAQTIRYWLSVNR
jgi:tetratricopeptide (TPR) repeat protein